MPEFMMLMKGNNIKGEWDTYINKLIETGFFRGGSALGNGLCIAKDQENLCLVTGFMRFEADNISQIRRLLEGNPVYEAGGEVELQELIKS